MARSSDHNFFLGLLLDKTFQAGEIRRVILLSTCYLAITTVMIGVFYYQVLDNLIKGASPLLFVSEDMALANEAVPTLSSMLGNWLLVMLGVNMIVTVALGIYITRRLGHPLLAIKRSLNEIGNGNLDVRLRADDNREFGEIANELTRAVESIREQISSAKEGIKELTPENKDSEQYQAALHTCKTALDYFQVEHTVDAANEQKAA